MLGQLLIVVAGLLPITLSEQAPRSTSGMPHIQGRIVQVVRQKVGSEPSADRGYITVQAEPESLLPVSLVHVAIRPDTEIRKKRGSKVVPIGLEELKEGQRVLVWINPREKLRHPVYPLRIDGLGIVIVRSADQEIE